MLIHALIAVSFDYDKNNTYHLTQRKELNNEPHPMFSKEFGKIPKLISCIQSSRFADILSNEMNNRRSGLALLGLVSFFLESREQVSRSPMHIGLTYRLGVHIL